MHEKARKGMLGEEGGVEFQLLRTTVSAAFRPLTKTLEGSYVGTAVLERKSRNMSLLAHARKQQQKVCCLAVCCMRRGEKENGDKEARFTPAHG
jgi:hypothetical protein